jgi:hypothetical protein
MEALRQTVAPLHNLLSDKADPLQWRHQPCSWEADYRSVRENAIPGEARTSAHLQDTFH